MIRTEPAVKRPTDRNKSVFWGAKSGGSYQKSWTDVHAGITGSRWEPGASSECGRGRKQSGSAVFRGKEWPWRPSGLFNPVVPDIPILPPNLQSHDRLATISLAPLGRCFWSPESAHRLPADPRVSGKHLPFRSGRKGARRVVVGDTVVRLSRVPVIKKSVARTHSLPRVIR
jgi:hypothetical protein